MAFISARERGRGMGTPVIPLCRKQRITLETQAGFETYRDDFPEVRNEESRW